MVKLKDFFSIFKSKKIVNFYGVPDSLLKDFIEYLNNKKIKSSKIALFNSPRKGTKAMEK